MQLYANPMSLTQVVEWKDTLAVLSVKMENTGDQIPTKKQIDGATFGSLLFDQRRL
jgi:hypothetical protein